VSCNLNKKKLFGDLTKTSDLQCLKSKVCINQNTVLRRFVVARPLEGVNTERQIRHTYAEVEREGAVGGGGCALRSFTVVGRTRLRSNSLTALIKRASVSALNERTGSAPVDVAV